MRSVIGYLNGKVVRVYTDNKNVPHILRVGSRKIILHEKVMSVHKLYLQNSVKMNAVWLLLSPVELNVVGALTNY
jgi:hypothetical protein